MNHAEKTQKDLIENKEVMENVELSDDDLDQVSGGIYTKYIYNKNKNEDNNNTEKKEQ